MVNIIVFLVHGGKMYISTEGYIPGGPYITIEPVYKVNLETNEIKQAMKKVIAAGHPRLEPPRGELYDKGKDPILNATGAKSWKALASEGATYTLDWEKDAIKLYMSRLDKKRVISGTVTVTQPPFFICSRNRGITEPREARTFP